MKILHISTRLIVGGSQENTILSCRGQLGLGHEVHLAFGPIYGPEGSMLGTVQQINRDQMAGARGITTHEVADMVRQIAPLRDGRCYRQLRALIREIRPDIVHTHSSKAGILGRAAAWGEGGADGRMGVVHTIHGPPFHRYEKRWRSAIYVMSERIAAKRCHVIVSVADAMTQQYLARRIGRPGQYVTVYSGMEVETFTDPRDTGLDSRAAVRTELGFKESDIVIGTVSRLADLKGHDDLIDALSDALRAHQDWKLLWVGDGWKRRRLEQRLASLGLRERVVMTGLVPPASVPRMIRAMDMLVHPSYREGLPRTVPQALLSSIPVVAYDVDGTGEVCIDGETGRLVPAGNVAALREAVEWMCADPARASEMARRGRTLCQARFDWRVMVSELERVYERAASAKGS